MDYATVAQADRFFIAQRFTAMVNRQRSFRDRYLVTIQVPGLDRRLAIAMGVALDALQQR